MKRAPGILILAAAAACAAWLAACANRVAGGGDATETGNARIRGVVVTEDGLPARGAEVTVLPSDYDPVRGQAVPDSLRDTTDAQGRYRFTKLADGEYNVAATHPGTRARLSIYGITLAEDSVEVPADTLHAPGAISMPLPETLDSGVGWVYIPGTQFRKRVDSELRISGSILIDSVPAGLVPSVVYTKGEADSRPIVLARGVPVAKMQTTWVDAFATWPFKRKLILNTATGAAATSKAQRDFPLLVRLAAPAFDFSKARAGGADLRFSGANGMPLAHEIETWDAVAGKADVWVRVDTIHAGRATQAITMHWGESASAGKPKARAVFDTLAGFAGAWHLGEEAADTVANGLYKDATGAGSHGNDRVRNASRTGVIGAGHGIDSGDYIEAVAPSKLLHLKKEFMLSCWYRATGAGFGPAGGEILNVGDNFGVRVYRDSGMHVWYWPKVPPAGAKTPWYSASAEVPFTLDGQWHLITGGFDGKSLRLYADGKEIATAPAEDEVGLQFKVNVTLGKHGAEKQGYEFQGDLDEAQVHSRNRDADWVKLAFENQRPGSGFPAFAP